MATNKKTISTKKHASATPHKTKALNHSEREDRIAELIFLLSDRDRDARAACRRMMATIAILGAAMDRTNRLYCAEALRSVGDEVEYEPRPVC
jgi:hypothetical protein